MSMDIRDIQNHRHPVGQRPGGDGADAAGRGEADRAGKTEAAPAGEQVRLSAEAQNLKSLTEAARADGEVDTAKVEQIRQEIAEGRYHVDARKLADRMIDLERALLG
jgi:negative regulator of flagellin synthesis FlgM